MERRISHLEKRLSGTYGVIREKVNIRVEGDLNVSLKELDKIY